jgi:hypothetical protein
MLYVPPSDLQKISGETIGGVAGTDAGEIGQSDGGAARAS